MGKRRKEWNTRTQKVAWKRKKLKLVEKELDQRLRKAA